MVSLWSRYNGRSSTTSGEIFRKVVHRRRLKARLHDPGGSRYNTQRVRGLQLIFIEGDRILPRG